MHFNITKNLATSFLVVWICLTGYLIILHLNRPNFRSELKILWKLQQVAHEDVPPDSLSVLVDVKSYLANVKKSINDKPSHLINRHLISTVLSDTTLSEIEKSKTIIRNDLNQVIKLNYGTCEINPGSFILGLRDRCHGDFNLKIKYVGAPNQWKVEEMLLYRDVNIEVE